MHGTSSCYKSVNSLTITMCGINHSSKYKPQIRDAVLTHLPDAQQA